MMNGDERTILTIIGNAGGRISKEAACFDALGSALSGLISAGTIVEVDGNYLMSSAGELALAAALAPGG